MATISEVYEALLRKRKKIDEALRKLDEVKQLLGEDSDLEHEVGDGLAAVARSDGKGSIAQKVYDAISERQLSVDQLVEMLGVSKQQVRNALQGSRLRNRKRSYQRHGTTYYFLPRDRTESTKAANNSKPTIRQAALDLLKERAGQPVKAKEVAAKIRGNVSSSAQNFDGAVAATLSNLVKDEIAERVRGEGYRYIGTE